MRFKLVVAIVIGTLWAASASAQTTQDPFQQLRVAGQLATGDSFVVKRRDGTRVTGKLEGLAPATLRLRVRGSLIEFAETEVDRIERRDPADNGALLGALAGVGALAALCYACDPEPRGYIFYYLGGPFVLGGGLVGYLVDRSIQDVVFDATAARTARLTVSPVVSRHYRGAALSLAW
jgi:hypothetical protein